MIGDAEKQPEPTTMHRRSADDLAEKDKQASFCTHGWPCAPFNGAEKLPRAKETACQCSEQGGPSCMVSRPCKLDQGRLGEGAVERRVHLRPLPGQPLQSGVAGAQGQVGLLLRRRHCKA